MLRTLCGAIGFSAALTLSAPLSAQSAAGATTQGGGAGGDSSATRAGETAKATTPLPDSAQAAQGTTPRSWYERISLRGYAQFRYNRLLETNERLACAQCDRSIGTNGGFFLRRGRLVVYGDVHPRVSIYIQPDYASDAAGSTHYLQLRDAYFDVTLDARREHRLRFGQSKVPFGFENLQSSQNRLPLDRNDALNSAVPNERDIGVIYFWASGEARRRLRVLVDSGLKGSGDYGVVALGVFNGQTANRPEANNSLHAVARLSYPWRLPGGQYVETGVSAYRGRFVLPARTSGVPARPEYADRRVAASLTWYAQPFGLVGEYNWGTGPEFVAASRTIDERDLQGGFVQSMYRLATGRQVVTPFVRLHSYRGGKKVEQDARHYEVHELELGVEWLPVPNFELTAQYSMADRVFEDAATIGNRQEGRLLRLQAQFNY